MKKVLFVLCLGLLIGGVGVSSVYVYLELEKVKKTNSKLMDEVNRLKNIEVIDLNGDKVDENIREEIKERYESGEKKIVWFWKGKGSKEVITNKITYHNQNNGGRIYLEERFNYENDTLRSVENYKDGKQDGLCRNWYENGQLEDEKNYKDGEMNGLKREWWENGQLKKEENYKDGEWDGLFRYWYENGQLEEEGNYKNGEEISKKCWDENGQLEEEGSSIKF